MDWKVLRPVAKELVRAGLVIYDQTTRAVTELVDGLTSLVDEARADLKKDPTVKTSEATPSGTTDAETIHASLRQGLNQDLGQHPEVLRALVQWLQQDGKGVSWLMARLKERGFAEHLTSWISSGPNRPLTAADVSRALDEPHLTHLGQHTQRSSTLVSEALAELIPALIDRLTPLGDLVSEDAFADGLAFLGEALL